MKTKHLALVECELKASGDGDRMEIRGYISRFGNKDRHGDVVVAGAFAKSIKSGGPWPLRFEHRDTVGKWLELKEDNRGLFGVGELTPGHSLAANAYALLKHEAVRGLSIGYDIPKGGARWDEEKGSLFLEELEFLEGSVVTVPSNPKTQVTAVKSADVDIIESLADAESFLREAGGFSRTAAKAFVARLCRMAGQREADDQELAKSLRAITERVQRNTQLLKS